MFIETLHVDNNQKKMSTYKKPIFIGIFGIQLFISTI